MSNLGRKLLLTGIVVALSWTTWTLKGKLGSDQAPTASLGRTPQEDQQRSPADVPRPRVLQAKPVTPDPEFLSPSTPRPLTSDLHESTSHESHPYPTTLSPVSALGNHSDALIAADSPASAYEARATPNISTANSPGASDDGAFPRRLVTDANDSFWSISERAYGTGTYYRALFRHNRLRVLRPDQLRAGLEIEVPSTSLLRQLYPADCPSEPAAGE